MNIKLPSKAAAAKKKKGLALGLNSRGATAVNAFVEGYSSSSDGEEGQLKQLAVTGREAVNRAIAEEQAALRARAAAAAVTLAEDGSMKEVYDYDGAYESFHPDTKKKVTGKEDSKESRYIGDLLKAAEQRKLERDVAHERKVARDQAAEEEAEPEFRGKEKFITAAYKRKLEERKVWHEQEEKQRKIEEENDVTKQTDGIGMASFYGKFTKNVAIGGGTSVEKALLDGDDPRPSHGDATSARGFLGGFATGDDDGDVEEKSDAVEKRERAGLSQPGMNVVATDQETAEDPTERRKQMRLLRERKVDEARARYFQRQGMTAGKV